MKKNEKKNENPKVAPGFEDERFGEDATRRDKIKGNVTKVFRFEPERRDRI